MKDILLTNIKVEIEHNLDFDVDVTVKNQNVVHQISGYLIYPVLPRSRLKNNRDQNSIKYLIKNQIFLQ